MRSLYLFSLACLGIAAVGCSTTDSCLITRPQSTAWNTDAQLPGIVQAPAGHVLLGHVIGRGVETFTLQPDPYDPNRTVWVPTRDEGGDLLDEEGNVVGHHESNSWAMRDGGQVSAEPIASIPRSNGSSWVLLQAASHEGGGLMGSAQFVQQLHTIGGPPAALAHVATLGTQFRAAYSADYYFYGAVAPQTRAMSTGG
jgi:hypothetical protein